MELFFSHFTWWGSNRKADGEEQYFSPPSLHPQERGRREGRGEGGALCGRKTPKRGRRRWREKGKGREVERPQKSIGWEERAEIICAVRGQRGRANRVCGGGEHSRTKTEATVDWKK